MKNNLILLIFLVTFYSCCNRNQRDLLTKNKAIFLHHSTGNKIWKGNSSKMYYKLFKEGDVQRWINKYNLKNKTNFFIEEQNFPKEKPYGWHNYPFDYYNIWVKNAGETTYMEEPTLEMLTKQYGLIILKHCFPVSNILDDTGNPDIDSDEKRLENYKIQYIALKNKMHKFPETKFLVWTGAALVQGATNEEKAKRMKEFVEWVKNEWDIEDDNIYIWDFYSFETEGGLYLKDEYSVSKTDSHPTKEFAGKLAPLFAKKVVDILKL